MEQIQELFNKLQLEKKLKKEIDKASDLFAFKPFVQEYFTLKKLAQIARPLLGVFSVVTGVGFLVEPLESMLKIYGAVVLALLLLIIIEVGKNQLSHITFRKLYSESSLEGWVLLPFVLLLLTISVYCSVVGAERLYERLDVSEEQLNTSFINEIS